MAAPSVEVNITTKDGKSSNHSESVADVTGNVTLPVLNHVLNKIQIEVNSSLTVLVEEAKKSECAAATGAAVNWANDELDDDSEEDEDKSRLEKRKSNEELGNQKVAKVR